MKKYRWLSLVGLLALVISALGGVAAAPSDAGPPDPGPLPPGLAVKVFVHYPKGHGPEVDATSAAVCADPSPAACGDYAIAATSGGKPIRWADPTSIPYYVTLNYSTRKSPNLSKPDARVAIDASFVAWEAASDAGLNYTKAGELDKATLPRLDGKNVVGWKGLKGTAIAVTYVWYYTSTGNIAEFDMVFNNNFAWTYTAPTGITSEPYDDPDNSGVANTFDVRNIGSHEAGHTLMLLDLYDASHANLTMYGYGAYAELKKDTLALGDDLGVKAIY